MTIDREMIERVADQRWEKYERLKGRTYRPFASECGKRNRFYVGLIGEAVLGDYLGLPVDFEERCGDGGKDFTLSNGLTVNVRAFRKPYNLPMQPKELQADIYVLAGYDDKTDTARLVGWATQDELKKAPLIDLGHYGLPVHCIPANKLHPIEELRMIHKG